MRHDLGGDVVGVVEVDQAEGAAGGMRWLTGEDAVGVVGDGAAGVVVAEDFGEPGARDGGGHGEEVAQNAAGFNAR